MFPEIDFSSMAGNCFQKGSTLGEICQKWKHLSRKKIQNEHKNLLTNFREVVIKSSALNDTFSSLSNPVSKYQ